MNAKLLIPALLTTTILPAANPSYAQFRSVVAPENMQVLNAKMPDATYRYLGSSEPGQLFFLNEPVNISLALSKGVDPQGSADFTIEMQQVTSRTPGHLMKEGGDFLGAGKGQLLELEGKPVLYSFKATFTAAPETQDDLKNLPVPKHYGVYALILTHGGTRQFLATVARIPEPRAAGTVENTPLFGDGSFFDDPARYPMRAQEYARLGVHGFRGEQSWSPNDKGEVDWTRDDALYSALEANHIQEMVTLESQGWSVLPFKEPVPAAGYVDTPYSGHGDWLIAPDMYPRYGEWITAFAQRYWKGGKGGIWAIENFNEPWEGGGISGWARDMLQYRALQKLIATSAWKVDRGIKIAAASSIMNTEDKLYPDGSKEFDQYIDIFTDHYVSPPFCYGPMVAHAHGKQSMESETWFADAQYKLPLVAARFMASGQDRIAPWNPAEIFDPLPGNPDPFFIPGPVVTATAAFNHFATGKPFHRVVFKDHLPWVFQFGGDADKDALLILFGQLTPSTDDPKSVIWSQVDTSPGGTITIDNHDGLLQFYDLAGNPEYQHARTVTLPMSIFPTYILCAKGPIIAATRLASAKITGKRPVEIIPHDFTSPVNAPGAQLVLDVHNCLTTPIIGTLSVDAPAGLTLQTSQSALQLGAGEKKSLVFNVIAGQRSPGNTYPFTFHFNSPSGNAAYAETLGETTVAHRTIIVDGNLDDWNDIPGTIVVAKAANVDFGELARRPWTEIKAQQPQGRFAEVKTAWDDNFFYVSARVNNPEPQMDKPRLAAWNDDSYFHTAADDNLPHYKEWLAKHPGHSYAEVPWVYARNPEPALAFRGDRLQIAFDVTPGFHDMTSDEDRVPYGFHAVPDTDYEYSAYLCADGKGELWREMAPGVPRIHDFPRQPKGPRSTGVVPGAQIAVRQDGSTRIYEIGIPRNELADMAFKPGTSFGFSFCCGLENGSNMDFGLDKAVTKTNGLTLHPYWEPKPSCSVRWKLAP